MLCHICNKKLTGGHRYYSCCDVKPTEEEKPLIKYESLKYNHPFISEDFMKEYYIDKMYSLPMFLNEYGMNYYTTQWLLDYFDIPHRSMKESINSNTVDRRKATCVNRYGVENPSQVDEFKEKKRETFMKTYGVDNIFKSPDFISWLPSRMNELYGKGSLPNRYGGMQKWWDEQTSEFKREHTKPAIDAYKKWYEALSDEERINYNQQKSSPLITSFKSSIEERVERILFEMKIPHKMCFWINQKSYDIRINDSKMVIEVNGDFWHANPLLYEECDVLKHPGGEILASELWEKDIQKKNNAKKYGYDVVYLWETEINEMSDEQLTEKIKELLYENNNS